MHSLAQGIAYFQKANDLVGESLNHGDLKPEPEIPHFGTERFAFREQTFGPRGKGMQALQQRRRRARLSELLDRGPGRCERVARKIDAIEISVVFAAILKMIVDLQAGAERIRRSPGRRALAMD